MKYRLFIIYLVEAVVILFTQNSLKLQTVVILFTQNNLKLQTVVILFTQNNLELQTVAILFTQNNLELQTVAILFTQNNLELQTVAILFTQNNLKLRYTNNVRWHSLGVSDPGGAAVPLADHRHYGRGVVPRRIGQRGCRQPWNERICRKCFIIRVFNIKNYS